MAKMLFFFNRSHRLYCKQSKALNFENFLCSMSGRASTSLAAKSRS
jgi:hypothetical protein